MYTYPRPTSDAALMFVVTGALVEHHIKVAKYWSLFEMGFGYYTHSRNNTNIEGMDRGKQGERTLRKWYCNMGFSD